MSLWSFGSHVLASSGNLLAQAEAPAAPAAAAAAGGSPLGGGAAGSGLLNIGMVVVMFVVFYFFVLRPQSKRDKEHKAFLANLKANDRVVLRSGIFGKLISVDGDAAKVEIADRVVIRVYKNQIAGAEAQAAEVVDSTQR